VHQDAGIQTNHIIALLNHSLPPGLLYIPLQRYTQGTVVPATGKPSVDFTTGEDETTPPTEGYNLFHINFG
jgi:hypothetical protein